MYILTDDQDLKLGSLEIQDKVKKLLVQEGMVFENAFVTTPVCCPSRYESIASHVRFEFVYIYTFQPLNGLKEYRYKFDKN